MPKYGPRFLEPYINVRSFGARGDGVTNDTGPVAAAINEASGFGGRQVVFPKGTYLVDSIIAKSNVWLDFGDSTIKKRVDGNGPLINSLILAPETLVNGSYYGTYSNIKITGGFLDAGGKTCPYHIVRLRFVDGLTLEDVTLEEYSSDAKWAFCLSGNHGLVKNCRIVGTGGTTIFRDGIHILQGTYWRVEGNEVWSGDDAIALGTEPTDAIEATDPNPLRYVVVANNVVRSEKGFALKVYVQPEGTAADWQMDNIIVSNLTGSVGNSRNGGMWLRDYTDSTPSQIRDVLVSGVSLRVGEDPEHDGVNNVGIHVFNVDRLTLRDVHIRLPASFAQTDYDVPPTEANVTFEDVA